jgi:N-formylglutamate deformylase
VNDGVPFVIERPTGTPAVVYDSPHSGREYPPDFASIASPLELRWAEDAYVDELLRPAVAEGAALLHARYPRAWLDLNRAPDDLDATMLDGPWPEPLSPSEKTQRGLGLIRRFVAPGVAIYGGPLPVAEVQRRIRGAYHPYHAALDALVGEVRQARGAVWHVNWHSMKSVGNAMTPDGAGATRADFVVSDRHGASAGPELTALVVDTLRGDGFTVSVNVPYAGGHIVRRLGAPSAGVHSVQVEINRRLYLDERAVTHTLGFEPLRAALARLTKRLAAAAPATAGGG